MKLFIVFVVIGLLSFLHLKAQALRPVKEIPVAYKAVEPINPVELSKYTAKTKAEFLIASIESWRPLVNKYFGAETDYALRIIKCESNGNPLAQGFNTNGSTDSGLFQVNSVHSAKVNGNLEALFNPETNVKVAKQIKDGSSWSAWTCARKI